MTDSSPSAVGRLAVLERTAELAALAGLVADLRPGTGRVAVVQGPPGIGKTTLVFALHQAARGRGLPLSNARGTELGMDIRLPGGTGIVHRFRSAATALRPDAADQRRSRTGAAAANRQSGDPDQRWPRSAAPSPC